MMALINSLFRGVSERHCSRGRAEMCFDFDRSSAISGWVPACYPPPWHAKTHTHTHTHTHSHTHTHTPLPATEDQANGTQAQWGNTSLICLPRIQIQLMLPAPHSSQYLCGVHSLIAEPQWLKMQDIHWWKIAWHNRNQTLICLCQVSNVLTDLFGPSDSVSQRS